AGRRRPRHDPAHLPEARRRRRARHRRPRHPTPEDPALMKRFGQLIGLWPEILGALRKAEIRNYSIFHFDGKLFAYFEYHGPEAEFAERMREIARAPRMREWWDVMDPMQAPVEGR